MNRCECCRKRDAIGLYLFDQQSTVELCERCSIDLEAEADIELIEDFR